MPDYKAINRQKAGKWVLQLLESNLLVIADSDDHGGVAFSFTDGYLTSGSWNVVGKLCFSSQQAWVEAENGRWDLENFGNYEMRTKAVVPWIRDRLALAATPRAAFAFDAQRCLLRARGRPELYREAWRKTGLILSRLPAARVCSSHPCLWRVEGASINHDGTVVPPVQATTVDENVIQQFRMSGAAIVDATVVAASVGAGVELVGFHPDHPAVLVSTDNQVVEHDLATEDRCVHVAHDDGRRASIWGHGEVVYLVQPDGELRSLRSDSPRSATHVSALLNAEPPAADDQVLVGAGRNAVICATRRFVQICRSAPGPLLGHVPVKVTATKTDGASSRLVVTPSGEHWALISSGGTHQFASGGVDFAVGVDPEGHPEDGAISPQTGLGVVLSRVVDVVDLETRTHIAKWSIGSKHKLRGDFSPDGRFLLLLASNHLFAFRPGSGYGFDLGYFSVGDADGMIGDANVQFSPCGRLLAVQGKSLQVLDWSTLEASLSQRPVVPFDALRI